LFQLRLSDAHSTWCVSTDLLGIDCREDSGHGHGGSESQALSWLHGGHPVLFSPVRRLRALLVFVGISFGGTPAGVLAGTTITI